MFSNIFKLNNILGSLIAIMILGCANKFLSENWSENFALTKNNASAIPSEINDGDLNTLGVTEYPKREYIITLPSARRINRIVVYSGNVISYDIFCWDIDKKKWISVSGMGRSKGKQKVYTDRYKLSIPRFDHRINFETDKIRLVVDRTNDDGVITTRKPDKNDKIINYRTDYIQMGRDRVRIELYDVFRFSKATIREIEFYSYVQGQGANQ